MIALPYVIACEKLLEHKPLFQVAKFSANLYPFPHTERESLLHCLAWWRGRDGIESSSTFARADQENKPSSFAPAC